MKKLKELKLEVGKTYRSREGKEVKITEFTKGTWDPFRGNNGKWYKESGQWASAGGPHDLIEEIPETTRHTFNIPAVMKGVTATRYTFAIPEGTKGITVEQVSNRIVVEMVPGKGPKPGDVCINENGSVYIFKAVNSSKRHRHYAWLGSDGYLNIGMWCSPGRPATPGEAQPLWDALKKAGKRWNPETMQVEDVPEIDRIREWVEANFESALYDRGVVAEAIEAYLKHKEAKK